MSKVNIDIDIGEAYDRLSILEIKNINKSNEELINQIKELQHKINFSIGSDLAQTIYNSFEYRCLKATNIKIFETIDKLRKEEFSENNSINLMSQLGLSILNSNDDRYEMKKVLQKKFFNNQLEEIKI